MFAAVKGFYDMVTTLIARFADLNASPVGKYGNALAAAVCFKDSRVVEVLIMVGANVLLDRA
jgi:hypothetical protein